MSESQVRILGLSGSTRKESFNSKLLGLALSSAERQGADVTHIDLGQTPLPFYDGDLEADQGLPENVQGLKKIFENVDGFIIATPEYNGFFPGILKNCFDWLSRRKDSHDPMLSSFDGKTAVLPSKEDSIGSWESFRLDNQSKQFLSIPGKKPLYSGVAIMNPSTFSKIFLRPCTFSGKP